MPLGILRGSRAHCLAGLQRDEVDLSQYPLRTYSDFDVFTVQGQEVHIFQGVNTVPQERFLVGLGDPAASHAGLEVPGVVPFLVSTLQVSARRRTTSPQPTEVGLPILTTEASYLIRWMFGRSDEMHAGHRLWRRLNVEELESLPDQVRPDGRIEPDARTAASYHAISGGIAAPEQVDFVQPRAGGLPHEPWLARSVDLAENWRVVVPNTSISPRPVIVPPTFTIIGQNFNILLCPSAEIALAVGAVLSRPQALAYLVGISPWSQGDTPRPRSKHVNVTLWSFQEHIRELLENDAPTLSSLADDLAEVWSLHVSAAISIARGQDAQGDSLRDRYRAIEPRDGLNSVPVALETLEDCLLTLRTRDTTVRLEFGTTEEASLAAVAAWTAIPQNLPVGSILGLRFERGVSPQPESIQRVLFERRWAALVGEPEAQVDERDADDIGSLVSEPE